VELSLSAVVIRYAKILSSSLQLNRLAAFFKRSLNNVIFDNKSLLPSHPSALSLSAGGSSTSSLPTIYAECFENQRWWAGLGWIPHMLRKERAAWSDVDGTVALAAKEDLEDPKVLMAEGMAFPNVNTRVAVDADLAELSWEWELNGYWLVDRSWTENLDDDGWSYTDHKWECVKKENGGAYLTRRRRWIRPAAVQQHQQLLLQEQQEQ
jgi:hypothetical protein